MDMGISKPLQNRISEAIFALDKEIEAVLENPASDLLADGEYMPHSGTSEVFDYRFRSTNPSLRFAENVKASISDKQIEAQVVTTDTETIVLRFADDQGSSIKKLPIEWENDFILRKLRDSVSSLSTSDKETGLADVLWHPERQDSVDGAPQALHNGALNSAQADAVQKSLQQQISFIWGPPGTGKTSTLGYVMANALLQGRNVLFASNTNRAVDVGCLSTIQALKALSHENLLTEITRFGESALDDAELTNYLFTAEVERWIIKQQDKATFWQSVVDELMQHEAKVDDLKRDGFSVPAELSTRIKQLENQLLSVGGLDSVVERLEKARVPNELSILKSKKLVCTTLARVCTSDMLAAMRFDTVVIDEASMASLPYMLALASKADASIVIAGDPMQLPPIALTQDLDARLYLEEDVFSRISGAKSTSDLFYWHDKYPQFTSFFDVQYRMRDDMAGLISSVFYDGRLRSSEERMSAGNGKSASVRVIDSSGMNPILEQREGGKGFQPVNRVHGTIVTDIARQHVYESGLSMADIGIIVPFRSGVYAYRRWLRDQGLDSVEVGTIHTYQGREKRLILFDTMMTGEVTAYGKTRHFTVRPFDEQKNGLSVPRLLNVALSRAKDRLILVADMRHIRAVYKEKFLGKLLEQASGITT